MNTGALVNSVTDEGIRYNTPQTFIQTIQAPTFEVVQAIFGGFLGDSNSGFSGLVTFVGRD